MLKKISLIGVLLLLIFNFYSIKSYALSEDNNSNSLMDTPSSYYTDYSSLSISNEDSNLVSEKEDKTDSIVVIEVLVIFLIISFVLINRKKNE